MLSEEGLGVGRLMTKANDRAKKDIREGMFVAVLYAVLHGEDRSVRLCSAGQTQPVLYSAKTGRAGFAETAGDNFPLGIIDGVEYEETILALEEGDCLVFYTDGVVEAVNEEGEMFGFDRLLEAVSRAGKGAAGDVLDALKGQVDSFVGRAPQHDDITIIVAAARQDM
jgi:sigma-B regulation protein RsbU (phosphoserine phosphatase)